MSESDDLSSSGLPSTEERSDASRGIDERSAAEIVAIMHAEDRRAWECVEAANPVIAKLIDASFEAFRSGGRLIYAGAGTSGRLGVLDASECPPTFGVSPDLVVGVIAGGDEALRRAIEGAEDSTDDGRAAMRDLEVSSRDVVCGIAASGSTPFVLGTLEAAKAARATTGLVTSNTRLDRSTVETLVDHLVTLDVGPEIIAGSTRMKCGTATKLVLNRISTGAMIRFGKVYDNLMVDVVATNAKLERRARRLVATLTGASPSEIDAALEAAEGSVKRAVVALCRGLDAAGADAALERAEGFLRKALEEH